MKLSVILATYNEEKNIKDCLESVRWVDEIVVVDGSSTDRTVQIASSIGRSASGRKKPEIKIFIRENPLMFHKNKQIAIDKACSDWILYLDADERVTPKLKSVIQNAIAKAPRRVNGYWFPRKNIIFGKWIRNTGWWPDYQLRLFRRGKAYLPCKSVHEQPEVSGKTRYLRTPLVHYNYQTVSQFVDRLNRLYTENDKNLFLAERKKVEWSDAIRWPAAEFLRRFFQQKGYRDGLHGLVLSLLQSFSSLVTFAKIWETQNFAEPKEANFLADTEQEVKRLVKEARWWFLSSRMKETKNPVEKTLFRICRKLWG